MVRETPVHRNPLRSLTELAELGAVIAPPVPAFYAKPSCLEEMVYHTLGRCWICSISSWALFAAGASKWKMSRLWMRCELMHD